MAKHLDSTRVELALLRAVAGVDEVDWVPTSIGGLRNLIMSFDREVANQDSRILLEALVSLAEEEFLDLRKWDAAQWHKLDFAHKNDWNYTNWFFDGQGFQVKLKHEARRKLSNAGYTPPSPFELTANVEVDLGALTFLITPAEALQKIERLIHEGEILLEEPSTVTAMIRSTEDQKAWATSGANILKQIFGNDDPSNLFIRIHMRMMPVDAGIQPKWEGQSEQTLQRIAILRSMQNAVNTMFAANSSNSQDKRRRLPRDPYPKELTGVRQDIDYWVTRQGEGLPDSRWEVAVGNRLAHLRELEQRFTEQEQHKRSKPSKGLVFHTALNTYSVIKQHGQGGSATVYEVRDSAGKPYALKVINKKGDSKIDRFKNELSFCLRNPHRNIIAILDHGVTSDGGLPFYVMNLYPKTLRDLISDRILSDRVLSLFCQILDGVGVAHGKDVCHRDIKPENILYDETNDTLVLADFGIARFKEEELWAAVQTGNHERLANFRYSAPEQRKLGAMVSKSADIYALGLILNEMFTGEVPQGTQFKHIGECSTPHAYLDNVVNQMIRQNPEQRPAIEVFRPLLLLKAEQPL